MTDQRQSHLFFAAAAFLFVYSIILSLSPAVRARSWDVDYRLSHWLGFTLWVAFFFFAHRETSRLLPDRDPYLLPLAGLLSGWGLLTIWRLESGFGLRQVAWLGFGVAALILGLRLPTDLAFLRRYKYILFTGSLFLTALTLIFGTNPAGYGPRLWLGCCGIYFQPSEPLKLLLVVYLAAYLADHPPIRLRIFPLLLPTLLVTGLALLLLLVQRDLGTASIFIFLYTVILFTVTGRGRVLLAATAALALAGLIGYFFIDIVHLRLAAWLDPWAEPSGRSYQIVQSLLAVANGGADGRGPGLGSPGLVPVAHSDFIFSAIAEETGLIGTIGLLAALGLLLGRGILAALRAPDRFRRFLAAGLTAYLGIQSLLIIGGNLRLFPLTGITLPFVSYGGSSLLTSFTALLFLLLISGQSESEPAPLPSPRPYWMLAGLLGLGLTIAALSDAWWSVIRGPDLLTRTDNPRRAIIDRFVQRGGLLDRSNTGINVTQGESGSYHRVYLYPDLGSVAGYTHPTYGQAGLEASLDDYLRGLQGNPASLIWWDHLLYGTPPPGLDVRLSLDLRLQERADELLGSHTGAAILINAQSGEILAIASHPTFDPNKLDREGPQLARDPRAPLVDRAAQGLYFPGDAIQPFIKAKFEGRTPSQNELQNLYAMLGFYTAPELRMPVSPAARFGQIEDLRVTPLQMAIAAAALSNHGMRPVPRIALAVNTPQQGWVILPASAEPLEVFPAAVADEAAGSLMVESQPYWQHVAQVNQGKEVIYWYLAGTPSNWQGTPLTVVVILEENNDYMVQYIGQELLKTALKP